MPLALRNRYIFRTTLAYAVGGSLWIFFSDHLLGAFADIGSITWLSTAKGFVFILVTTMLLNMALRAVPEPGLTPGRPRPDQRRRQIAAYALAIAASLAMIAVRLKITQVYGDTSQLILLVTPIVLAAFLGGLGPGLVATFICTFGTALTLPPVGSFRVDHQADALRLAALFITGAIISLLSAQLHRAYRRAEEAQVRLMAAAAQLRDSEAQLRLALRAARAATWRANYEDDTYFWSDEIWPLFGLAPQSRTPGVAAWLDTVHPADRDRIESMLGRPALVGQEFELEWRVKGPAETEARWLMSRGTVQNGPDGRPARYFGIVIDITERKRAEAQVQWLNADLERRVTERTAALSAANEELESFAFAVSHDLRTPLRSLMGMTQALVEDYGDALVAGARRYLTEIDRAGQRMSGLIGGLLALSRDSLQQLQDDAVDLSAIAADQLGELARGEPDRAVSVDVKPGIVTRGDGRLLTSVVQNLVGNAWKYTARTPEARIRVHDARRDGRVWFCVTDNGPGFDDQQAMALFKPFQRLHAPDEFPGLGIGLATVRRIVQRHGGRVEAEGSPGKGATFSFTLPGLTSRTAATDPGTP